MVTLKDSGNVSDRFDGPIGAVLGTSGGDKPGDPANALGQVVSSMHRRRPTSSKHLPPAFYMDVGAWQTAAENERPTMTFALLCHDTLALCSYHSTGRRLSRLTDVDTRYLLGAPFDFRTTRAYQFLEELFTRRYGPAFVQHLEATRAAPPTWTEFHVMNLVPFAPLSLLDDSDTLCVILPDLHLHYFKDSLLDNFITYYDNSWSGNGPIEKPHACGRASMERDMGLFLGTVATVQQKQKELSHLKLMNLGDQCEMWETSAVAHAHCVKKDAAHVFTVLGTFIRDVAGELAQKNQDPEMRKLLEELATLQLESELLDPSLKSQIDALNDEPGGETAKKLTLSGETEDDLRATGSFIESEVLKKYTDSSGKTFGACLESIMWKYNFAGNHDNYLSLPNADPMGTFAFSYEGSLGPPTFASSSAVLKFAHGHQFDVFNNDQACAIGMMVTYFLTFFEAKRRGGLLKKAEGLIRGTYWRNDLVKALCRTFTEWDREGYGARTKVAILAHTHVPLLMDLSNEYAVYSTVKHSMDQGRIPPPTKRSHWLRLGSD